MKMIQGAGFATDYGLYISNCQARQRSYKIPVTGLGDVQLYVGFPEGATPADTAEITLAYTCNPLIGTTETLTPISYVVGQDPDGNYYAVFKGFNESIEAGSFVIAIAFTGVEILFFSEEYEVELCKPLTTVLGCYGNLEPELSFDAEGIYFGQSQGGTLGDASVVYEHKFLMRDVEVSLNAIKNDFKSGQTRNFRTESTKLSLFWGEFIPGWYLPHVDTVFKRGEIYIVTDTSIKKWLLDNTIYENIDDCSQCWRPAVLLKENHNNSFSCEEDPCTVVVDGGGGGGGTDTCCSPTVTNATVEFDAEFGNTVCLTVTECEPTPANGYVIQYRKAGTFGGYIVAVPEGFCFNVGGEEGDQFEGYIFSDCGDGITGSLVPWSTGTPAESSYTLQLVSPCAAGYSPMIVSGGVEGDSVVIRTTFSGNMARTGGSFVRANLLVRSPYITDPPTFSPIPEESDVSACYTDMIGHGFNIVVDITIIMPAGDATFDVTAIVHNTNPVIPKGVLMEIVSVNGDPVTGVSQIGCAGTSVTAGTC